MKLSEMSKSEIGNQQERSVIDAARLAMLFDTDGFITMRVTQRMKNRAANVTPEIGAVNTCHALIDWAVAALESFGVTCYRQTIDWTKYKWSRSRLPQSRLSILGIRRSIKIIPIIRPYLIAKGRQADLLEEFALSRLSKNHNSLYTDRELECANEARSLNSNKGGAFRPISSTSIRQARELQRHLKAKMCSDLHGDMQNAAEMIASASA